MESIKGGRLLPNAVRELRLSMNTIPFGLCPSGPRLLHISMYTMHQCVPHTNIYTDILMNTAWLS